MNQEAKLKHLFQSLKATNSNGIPNSIKDRPSKELNLLFQQIAQIMPNNIQQRDRFCWALFYCLEHLFIDDKIIPPPRRKTLQTISLVKKALKATQQAKKNGEDNMFLPITSFSQLEDVDPYLGYFDDAEKCLKKSLAILENFKKWAYASNSHKSNRVMGLWLLEGFFSRYLVDKKIKIEPVEKRTFEKQNSKNIYIATSLKLTTNTANALGFALTEDVIRKRLQKFGGPLELRGVI